MKNINKFNEFSSNEKKILENIEFDEYSLKSMFNIIGYIMRICQKMKGIYIAVEFKNKNFGYDVERKITELLDYSIFNILKIHISKKTKDQKYNKTFTEFVKLRINVDLYNLIDSILNDLNEKNIIIYDKNKDLKDLKILIDNINSIKSIFKKIDDQDFKEDKITSDLKELLNLLKSLDPRNPDNIDKKDTLNESVDNKYNDDFIITKIKEQYPYEKVKNIYIEEKKAWSDKYIDGTGAAEDVILSKLMGWFEEEYSEISDDVYENVFSKLQEEYDFLKIK